MTRSWRFAIPMMLTFALGACLAPQQTTTPQQRLTAQAITPATGSVAVRIDSLIQVVLNRPADAPPLEQLSFTMDDGNAPVSGNATVSANVYTFTPGAPLAYATTYTVTFKAWLPDRQAEVNCSWEFTTEAAPYTIQFGSNQADFSRSLALDLAGTPWIAGETMGSLPGTGNLGNNDGFFSQVNSATPIHTQIGTSQMDMATAVGVDKSGNLIVAGQTSGAFSVNPNGNKDDLFLAKFDTSGAEQWRKQVGGLDNDSITDLTTDLADNILVTGRSDGSIDNTAAPLGPVNSFIGKADALGNKLWVIQFGSANSHTQANSIATDPNSGDIYVAGDTDGILGTLQNQGGLDIFLRKYDPSGNLLWSKQIGSSGNETVSKIAVDGQGNVFITGHSSGDLDGPGANANQGGIDLFAARLDRNGNVLWMKQMGSPLEDQSLGLALDAKSNVYLCGYSTGVMDNRAGSVNAGGRDVVVLKLSATGTLVWSRQFGSAQDDEAYAVAIDNTIGSNGQFLITGNTWGSLDGNPNLGSSDVFVSRLDSAGNWR